VKAELRDQTSALVWSYATQLVSLDNEANLVHGDFGNRNLLVQKIGENWTVAAVLDWEFAIAGSPLTDVGHFLRYEGFSHPKVEPHFSNGYLQAGGRLPQGWRRLARVIDLIALCESLTHDVLPQPVIAELIELVSATVEDRDPQFS
jgi:aminoglycoside phosphotransferase (APT) family kinase protein